VQTSRGLGIDIYTHTHAHGTCDIYAYRPDIYACTPDAQAHRSDIYAYRPEGDSELEGHEAHKLEPTAADATVA
jgi:hypothetical protein